MDNTPTKNESVPNISMLPEAVRKVLMEGDLSKLNVTEKITYYGTVCESLGMNPFTQPFDYINFQGKQKLYANKNCAEQLRKIYGISVSDVTETWKGDLLIVKAFVMDATGRSDVGTAALTVKGLGGVDLANAIMKCETKAKRRATLSICGLGMLDETEVTDNPKIFRPIPVEKMHNTETMQDGTVINKDTGEIIIDSAPSQEEQGDEWAGYAHRYEVPPYVKGKDMKAVRDALKKRGFRWRPAKDREGNEIPGGDNLWYGNDFIEKLSDFHVFGPKPPKPNDDDDIPESWGAPSKSNEVKAKPDIEVSSEPVLGVEDFDFGTE